MTLYYEDFDADHMSDFIDPSMPHESLQYYHAHKGHMYATDGRKIIRCKTKLPDGLYQPHSVESIHSKTNVNGPMAESFAESFDWVNDVGVKVKTVNLHDVPFKPSKYFSAAIMNIADDIWLDFDYIRACFTGTPTDFTFHYTEWNKPIYVKEEVYEFLCMPYSNK